MRPLFLLFVFVLACAHATLAQPWQQIGKTRTPEPEASWIAPRGVPGDAYGVYHFRKTISLGAKPAQYVVHVSADNRYRLFVNGRQVANGPQRSDVLHWRYETVDLAPYLNAGSNVVAALVWNWGPHKPVGQHTVRTGFLLWGEGPAKALNTGESWKVFVNEGYAPLPVTYQQVLGYYAAPPGEQVDASRYPWGWEQAAFSDASWPAAAVVREAQIHGSNEYGNADAWELVSRTIPPMEETPIRFATVRRPENMADGAAFVRGEKGLTFGPNTKTLLLLDQSHLTNAFLVLQTNGGRGSSIRLTYAEGLRDERNRKGNRNEIEGKHIIGVSDVFRPDGGNERRFQTLWFRTYRYVQVDIETADQSLEIRDLHGIFTAYPMQERARFDSDVAWLRDMWQMNWRVARLCAWETYFDTPYYEQLQYVGDTRIQALISLYMSGDDRLVRQAITHFDMSRVPEGITGSRYPSSPPQFIPPFSLIWVAMVHDYHMHRDDPAFVRELLPGVRSVLGWFERHLDENGLLNPLPWWPFVDWSWPGGNPPGAKEGQSVVISLQYVYALDRAAQLEEAFGRPADAARYRQIADRIRAGARKLAWNAGRNLLSDTPGSNTFSQQANVLAILTNTIPENQQRALLERVLADTSITHSTYYFTFYNFEALQKVGLADRYIEQLGPWQEMLALGLTTTLEEPEPSRSDSHAWAAHPNYGLLATVLGIRPAEPGFKSVRIAPAPGQLRRISGSVPHPAGDIVVSLERSGASGLQGTVTLPPGLSGTFVWNGRSMALKPGSQSIRL